MIIVNTPILHDNAQHVHDNCGIIPTSYDTDYHAHENGHGFSPCKTQTIILLIIFNLYEIISIHDRHTVNAYSEIRMHEFAR